MKKEKINKIKINIHEPYKMAEVFVNGESQFLGNFWDYHSGCHGTIWEIKGKVLDLGTVWSGHRAFAVRLGNMMKNAGLGDYKIEEKYRKRPIKC